MYFLVTFHPCCSVLQGTLLPWDQLAMWAVTVGTNMARATPFLGNEGPFAEYVLVLRLRYDARALLIGGSLVGPPASVKVLCFTLHIYSA